MQAYRSPNLISTYLLRVGDLSLNTNLSVPEGYLGNTWNKYIGTDPLAEPTGENSEFQHPDAAASILARYDNVIIDIKPYLDVYGNVSTKHCVELYRKMLLQERPCWILIRCDGYLQESLLTRTKALAAAKSAMASIWADMLNYQTTRYFSGFAFLEPNLNAIFLDETSIDRKFQNELVQECHQIYNRPAIFITSRPADSVTRVGPSIAGNPSSSRPLDFPLLGKNPVYKDKLLALYPYSITNAINVSMLLAYFNAFKNAVKQDRTASNLECAIVFRPDQSQFVIDNIVGTAPVLTNQVAWAKYKMLVNFIAALGITHIGTVSDEVSSIVLDPFVLVPTKANTSNQLSDVTSVNGQLIVKYLDASIETTRMFQSDLIELHG